MDRHPPAVKEADVQIPSLRPHHVVETRRIQERVRLNFAAYISQIDIVLLHQKHFLSMAQRFTTNAKAYVRYGSGVGRHHHGAVHL